MQTEPDHSCADLRPDQIRLLFAQSGVALVASIVAGICLAAILWTTMPHDVLLEWLAVLSIVTIARACIIRGYQRAAPELRDGTFWLSWFLAGVAASGLFWGTSVWVLGLHNSITLTGLMVLWIGGLSSGSVAALSVLRRAFFAFSVPALVPLTLYLLVRGPMESSVLGGAIVMFFGFISINALRTHGALTNALTLQHENDRLVQDLNREKDQVEDLNRDLENRVQQRTEEVVAINTSLKAEIRERRGLQDELQTSLKEKDVLMREVHHRVKNNFQIIISLLNLQSRQVGEQSVETLFDDCAARIQSIAMVHDQLYRNNEVSGIALDGYLRQLVQHIASFNDAGARDISVQVTAPAAIVSIDIACCCGLIVNELLSNVFKHAFPASDGGTARIVIGILDDELLLTVEDDGIGLPVGLAPEQTGTLGLDLVAMFVDQLSGRITWERRSGTSCHIRFPFVTGSQKRA